MGRLKKSAIEKRLSGNPGKRSIENDFEIEPIEDASPPCGMNDDQKKYWNLYAPHMIKNRLLTSLNRIDLQNLCFFEEQRDKIQGLLMLEGASLLQEKKNYHGDVVDLVEGVYSKLLRNYTATIRVLKADLKLRTDKAHISPVPRLKNKFEGLLGAKKQ